MDFTIEGDNLPSLDEAKDILVSKGWNLNKGKVPGILFALQTYDDEDRSDGIITGRRCEIA